MFTDEQRNSVWEQIRQSDLQTFAGILSPQVFSQAAERADLPLGRGVLNLGTLTWLALSAALRPKLSFCLVLVHTFANLSKIGCLPSPRNCKPPARGTVRHKRGAAAKRRARHGRRSRKKHDPRVAPDQGPSEEAFVQARNVMPVKYWVMLFIVLGELYELQYRRMLTFQGFRLLALDGTTIALPHHKALGDYFGFARNQHSKRRGKNKAKPTRATAQEAKKGKKEGETGNPRPQARMVMLLLATVRMPWRYELTPRDEGESTVAARLLKDIRPNDMVLMDRGFFHFDLFQQISDSKAFFAIRRVKRLRLTTLRRISRYERIVLWKPTSHRWKGATMKLRVIDYQVKGHRKTSIITNFLDEKRIDRTQFVGLSQSEAWATERDLGLYHQRWQIETAFRELKRVQELHGRMRGKTPEAIRFEVAGHVLLHLLTRWLMSEAAEKEGLDPLRLSFKDALLEIQNAAEMLPLLAHEKQTRLLTQLLHYIAAHTVPFRPGRQYPRKNDGKTRRTGAGHVVQSSKLR
jgi:hypothetical protein